MKKEEKYNYDHLIKKNKRLKLVNMILTIYALLTIIIMLYNILF